MRRLLLSLAILLLVSACSQVTVRTSGEAPLIRAPDWAERYSFFMYGLVGEYRVDAAKICGDRDVEQVAMQSTFWDGVFKLVTLTLYTPKTAMVWCRKEPG